MYSADILETAIEAPDDSLSRRDRYLGVFIATQNRRTKFIHREQSYTKL